MNDREREKEAEAAHKHRSEKMSNIRAGLARDAPEEQAEMPGLGAKAVRTN